LDAQSPEALALQTPGAFSEERISLPVQTHGVDQSVRKELPWIPSGVTEPFMQQSHVDTLKEGFAKAVDIGLCERVLVAGDPGMGKTRLAREFMTAVDSIPKYVFLADGHDDGAGPLVLFRNLLKSRYDISPDLDPVDAGQQLFSEIVALHDGTNPELDAHLVGFLLGMSIPGSPFSKVRSEEKEGLRFRAMQAFTRVLARDARNRALLFVVDEYHLASPSSRNLLSHIYRSLQGHPVWIVALARPESLEHHPELREAEHHFELKSLKRVDMTRLVRSLLTGIEAVPEDVLERVLKTAAGNPYAAYHVLLYLHEMGVIERDSERWVVDETAFFDLEIPNTLSGVAASRYQRLRPDEKEMLACAAVVGRRFRMGTVLAIKRALTGAGRPGGPFAPVSDDVEILQAMLDRLTKKAFVKPISETRVPGEKRYEFTTQVDRDLVLESLLPEEKERIHRIVGDWYDVNVPDGAPEKDEVLALHYEHGGSPEKAGRHALEAGQEAARSFRNAEAVALLETARRLLGDSSPAAVIRANEALGSVYLRTGELELALERLEEMLDISWRHRARSRGAVTLTRLASVHRALGENESALKLSLRALDLFKQVKDRQGVADACDEVGRAFWTLGDFQRALGYFKQETMLRAELKDEWGLGTAYLNVATVYVDRGRFDRARKFAKRAGDIFERVNDPVGTIRHTNIMAVIESFSGSRAKAIELTEQALDLTRTIGDRTTESVMLNNLADNLREHDPERARKLVHEALDLAERVSNTRVLADGRFILSAMLASEEKWAQALARANEGLRAARDTKNRLLVEQGRIRVAKILLQIADSGVIIEKLAKRDPLEEAITFLETSCKGLGSIGSRYHQSAALGVLAEAFTLAGRDVDARKALSDAENIRNELAPDLSNDDTGPFPVVKLPS
jgi:tetratricopeptide (TPR) repeat protein